MTARTRLIMGMPITLELVESDDPALFERAFGRFAEIDRRFSPYRDDSELAAFNAGRVDREDLSAEFRHVLQLADDARRMSGGYFEIRRPDGRIDPSGIVKGWAIREVAELLRAAGQKNFLVDAGGDVQVAGVNSRGEPWRVGIRHPFAQEQMAKVIRPLTRGVATSGTYIRGDHIYDPLQPGKRLNDFVSLTVVAADIVEADILATAAFAMGRRGLDFLCTRPGVEAYAIDRDGIATFTPGFASLVAA